VDHYGFLPRALKNYRPLIYLHTLDARVLENFDERIVMAKEDMRHFFLRSGMSPDVVAKLLQFYVAERDYFPNIPVDIRLRDRSTIPGGGEVIHTPGHCPGLVCIRFGDILLSTDLVLSHVTPHLSPQALHPFFGLENFIISLYRIASLSGIRMALASHGPVIFDLNQRIQEILTFHQQRLERLLDLCEKPRTVTELSQELFGERKGYDVILAIEECAAHLEYLHHHGWVRVANLEELLHRDDAPPRYVVNQELKLRKKAPTLLPLNS
jgi:glyoxylase-like metal-dependent hydrolase (beta-lactamase superfamily II)